MRAPPDNYSVARVGKGLVLTHSTDRKPVNAAVAVHALVVRTEAKVPRAVRAVREERTRPVEAVAASVVERTARKVASGGQKEAVAVRASIASPVDSVLCCPLAGGVVLQF